MQVSAQAIANLINGTVEGDPDVQVTRPSRIETGGEGSISFLADGKYEQYAYTTTASVLLVQTGFKPTQPIQATLIRVQDVRGAVAQLLEYFNQREQISPKGVSEQAFVHPTAAISTDVTLGKYSVVEEKAQIGKSCVIYDQVYIGKNVRIGDGVILHPGVKIYQNCVVGNNCIIHANAVIGSDGFGFVPREDGSYQKIIHVGNVVLEDNVEIGSNTTIDRATMDSTIIRAGAKLDNLIQIGHNVEIGENTVIAAQTGVAGSTKIGKNCQIGGQVGFAGHLKIADGTRIQAQSGIGSHITEPNSAFFGSPAIAYTDYVRSYSVFKKLPELYKTIHKLEQRLKELEG